MTTRFRYRQPILADEVQTFKALITVHKVLQEGHPIAVKEAQANINWLESLTRGVTGEGLRGMDSYCARERLQALPKGSEGLGFEGQNFDGRDRIWTSATRLCILPLGQIGVPQAASRIQRFGFSSKCAHNRG